MARKFKIKVFETTESIATVKAQTKKEALKKAMAGQWEKLELEAVINRDVEV